MERITDPIFRNEYGECEKERLEKRMDDNKIIRSHLSMGVNGMERTVLSETSMERIKAIQERLLAYQTDHDNTGKNMDAEYEFNSHAESDIEYLLAEYKRLREAQKQAIENINESIRVMEFYDVDRSGFEKLEEALTALKQE